MRFALTNRIKSVVALSPDSYSLPRFQIMRFVFSNRIKAVVASKLLDQWLPESYLLPKFQ